MSILTLFLWMNKKKIETSFQFSFSNIFPRFDSVQIGFFIILFSIENWPNSKSLKDLNGLQITKTCKRCWISLKFNSNLSISFIIFNNIISFCFRSIHYRLHQLLGLSKGVKVLFGKNSKNSTIGLNNCSEWPQNAS